MHKEKAVVQFTQEEVKELKSELTTLVFKANVARAKANILKVSLSAMTTVVVVDAYPFLNQWYWYFLVCLVSLFLWEAFSTFIATGAVKIFEYNNQKKK